MDLKRGMEMLRATLFGHKESVNPKPESVNPKPAAEPHAAAELPCPAAPQYLAGAELRPPRIHPVSWKDGQVFSESDDPDRVGPLTERWVAPSFVQKTPALQMPKTRVEELDVSGVIGARTDSFARRVYGVLEPAECAELLERVNEKGFTPALLNIGRGFQELSSGVRDGQRVIVDSPEFTAYVFEFLRPHLPQTLRGSSLVELNERCRFLCYTPGQHFEPHCDGRFTRQSPHPNAGDSSRVTVQLYLHDVPAAHGGATTFMRSGGGDSEGLVCQPVVGSALLFTQELLHEGSLVTAGLKYTLRTEAMYRPLD